MVQVSKRDGHLCLCVDYKVVVNPSLDVGKYPRPKPKNMFSNLSKGESSLLPIWLRDYNQLLLDEESRQYVPVNMHKGLYCYTRLPVGIASDPAIFHRTMDSILQGINRVVSHTNDIIITRKDDLEHLACLEEVFRHLQKYGARAK